MLTAAQAVVRPDSRISFHELVVHREPGREPILGCPRVRWFIEVDDETLRAVDALQRAGAVDRAAAMLKEETGEEYELREFVASLARKGFLREIDGEPVEGPENARERHPVLHAVPTASLRWLRSPAIPIVVVALALGWLATFFLDPTLRPHYADVFVTPRPMLALALAFGGLLGLAYLHELAHFFVARSMGVDATIAVSHRFYLLVLQTDVTNAWILPARQKLAIFLAGIAFNVSLASLTGLYLALGVWGMVPFSPEWEGPLRFFVYLNVFPLIYQLFIPARTDLYHVILVLTGERNLLNDALQFVRFRFLRAVAWLRGERGAACAECADRVMPDDPFCLACGTIRQAADPNKWGFSSRARGWLLGAGIALFLGTLLGYSYFLLIASRVLTVHVIVAMGQLGTAIAERSTWLAIESGVALLLAAAQLAFATYFVSKGLYSLVLSGPAGWVQRRYLPRLLTRLPWRIHSRVVGLAIRAFPQNMTYFERVPVPFHLVSARRADIPRTRETHAGTA